MLCATPSTTSNSCTVALFEQQFVEELVGVPQAIGGADDDADRKLGPQLHGAAAHQTPGAMIGIDLGLATEHLHEHPCAYFDWEQPGF